MKGIVVKKSEVPPPSTPSLCPPAYLTYSEVLGRGVALPEALACCFAAAGVVALVTVLKALSLVLALVPNTVRPARHETPASNPFAASP